MAVVAAYNLKGGVGKTATTVNLACLSAAAGYPTLVWDLDPQGAAGWYLDAGLAKTDAKRLIKGESAIGRMVNTTPYENLFLLPASFSYRYMDVFLRKVKPRRAALSKMLAPFAQQFPMIFLDCPPSLSHLAENVFEAADSILLPTIPTWLSIRALAQLQGHFAAEKLDASKLRPFYSMADRRRSLHAELLAQPPAPMKQRLKTVLPYSSLVEQMGAHRAPVFAYGNPSHPVVQAYANLWQELIAQLPARARPTA